MIVGICADVISDIKINLLFFDEKNSNPCKIVELKKNNVYHFTYYKNNTIYECDATVIELVLSDNYINDSSHVKKYVGNGNEPYFNMSKDDFMKYPKMNSIYVIIDTSDDLSNNIDKIPLDSISDCTLLDDKYHYSHSCINGNISIKGENVTLSNKSKSIYIRLSDLIDKFL